VVVPTAVGAEAVLRMSQLSSSAATAVPSASGARWARRASSPPVVLVAKGTVVASDPARTASTTAAFSPPVRTRAHTPRTSAHRAVAFSSRCAVRTRAPRCSMACVRTRVRTASTMRAQGGAHGRREGTCCCSCLLRPSCSWTPDLRLHLPPAGCSCVDYPEPSPEIRSRKWVK